MATLDTHPTVLKLRAAAARRKGPAGWHGTDSRKPDVHGVSEQATAVVPVAETPVVLTRSSAAGPDSEQGGVHGIPPGTGPMPVSRDAFPEGPLDAPSLRALCLACGAEDVGFVAIDDPHIAVDRASLEQVMPGVRSLVGIVCRMPMYNVRSPQRSVANQAFHTTGHEVDEVARRIVLALIDRSVPACNPSMAFPMEVQSVPESRPWVVSHKLVAEAAGLGVRGIHRSVIHPKYGSFVLLGTVLVGREIAGYSTKLDYNPCVECKLCVAACPVGAIAPDGHFNFTACSTHNYREFLTGFTDYVETIADSKSARHYRQKVEDGETLSMWQSLAFGPNYKAAYCLSVCPAGEDVLPTFLDRRSEHLKTVVKPLQAKEESIYVIPGSDAEAFVTERYPHKRVRHVHSGFRPTSIASFLTYVPHLYQRGRWPRDTTATLHFVFTGADKGEATVTLTSEGVTVARALVGKADATIRADGKAWVSFVRKDVSLARLILTGKLRLSPLKRGAALLTAFGKCFPS